MKRHAFIPHKDTLFTLITEQKAFVKNWNEAHEKNKWLYPLSPLWAFCDEEIEADLIKSITFDLLSENESDVFIPLVISYEKKIITLHLPIAKKLSECKACASPTDFKMLPLSPKSIRFAEVECLTNGYSVTDERWLRF